MNRPSEVEAFIFGGTTEGRLLCQSCTRYGVAVAYCAATEDGARSVMEFSPKTIYTGRLNAAQMAGLISSQKPRLVLDATHPYAQNVSLNIAAACQKAGAPLVKVRREIIHREGCTCFNSMEDMVNWLKSEPGDIFAAAGASAAEKLAQLPGYQKRVWLRILPNINSLNRCISLGYLPERIICMHGPFSRELNIAMFQNAHARILVTKNSGSFGGFDEKIDAAKDLSMAVAVLEPPVDGESISLNEAINRIMELRT